MNATPSFWPLLKQVQTGKFIELTHACDVNIPHFEQTTPMRMEETATYQKEGYSVQSFQFEGQWGTHVDAPAHFCEGKKTLDQISLKEMILPLVVIDIHEQTAKNSDYILTVNDILSWEDQYGRIPCGAFVALRTDWSKRWPDNAAMHNLDEDGISHTPGWSMDALTYLYSDCQITASGQETINPDPGFRAKEDHWRCERYILERNCYQVELMTNLDQCPLKGAIVICSFPKVQGATGFPARVFAICPVNNSA